MGGRPRGAISMAWWLYVVLLQGTVYLGDTFVLAPRAGTASPVTGEPDELDPVVQQTCAKWPYCRTAVLVTHG